MIEARARARGVTPEGALVAIFDVFAEWFQRDEDEATDLIHVLLEIGPMDPLLKRLGSPPSTEQLIVQLATEAGIADAQDFAHSWHILMRGSLLSHLAGEKEAASRATEMVRALLDHHLPNSAVPPQRKPAESAPPCNRVSPTSTKES